jgi:hypothetical protein
VRIAVAALERRRKVFTKTKTPAMPRRNDNTIHEDRDMLGV